MKTSISSFIASILLGTVLTAVGQPSDVRQGLVFYWPLDAAVGTITPDQTPSSNHLSLVGMDSSNFVPGQRGNAALFNGTSTYLSIAHSSDNSITGLPIYRAGTYTITMWVKGAAQTAKYLLAEGSTTSNNPLLILQTGQVAANNAKLDVIIRNDGNTTLINHLVSTTVVFDNNWHHIAWVDDRGSVKLYVDGNLDTANFNYVPSGVFTFNTTAIGTLIRAAVSTGAIFNGLIDDMAGWERTLTQGEIQQVMTNSLTTPIPDLPPF